jgi:predicted DNA-binding protein with PD1-like motif
MKAKSTANMLIIRLDENDEVISSIKDIMKSEGLVSGIVVSFVGALKSCRLILQKGLEKTVKTHVEAVGNGNLSYFNGEPFVHIHVSTGNNQGVLVGHLLEGVVDVFCEIAIIPLEMKLTRKYEASLAESGVTVPYILDFECDPP